MAQVKAPVLVKPKKKLTDRINIRDFIPFIGLILIVLFFQVISEGTLLSIKNMKLILNQSFALVIGTVSCSFIVAQGDVDFSMGSMVGITAVCAAWTAQVMPVFALPVAMAVGLIFGMANGLLYVKFHIPSFVVTLSTLLVLRGLTIFISGGGSVSVPFSMYIYDNSGLKLIVVLVVIAIACFAFNYTKVGKFCKAVGSGAEAAFQSGVPVSKMRIFGYALSATMCGLCGFFNMVRAGSAATNTGNLFETDVLIALVLGGMPLSGGASSKIRCAVIGSLILAVLANGLVFWNVNEKLQQGIKGVVFLVAVWLTFDKRNAQVIK